MDKKGWVVISCLLLVITSLRLTAHVVANQPPPPPHGSVKNKTELVKHYAVIVYANATSSRTPQNSTTERNNTGSVAVDGRPPPPATPPQPPRSLQNATNETRTDGSKKVTGNPFTDINVIFRLVIAIRGLIFICFFIVLWARGRKTQQRLQQEEIAKADSLRFDIMAVRAATNNFSSENELGRGGFGRVYKGTLADRQEVAVKRLSMNSRQGDNEFMTEVLLVAKLQHRNLVRLLGFCTSVNEKILIYEFVSNGSLDHFLFDPNKGTLLNWGIRSKIIQGIARGLLYLHEDSRLRIIHRDLKAANILLDQDMSPKIADFGLARLFRMNETQGSTNTIMGTHGYMAPEYAKHGQFSVKTDVFSYGVMILEIISGRRNRYIPIEEDDEDLLSCAWRSWSEGSEERFVDPTLISGPIDEQKRCINIGLLCVQDKVAARPTMALVVHMLNVDSLALPEPSRPPLIRKGVAIGSDSAPSSGFRREILPSSLNECTMTELHPR